MAHVSIIRYDYVLPSQEDKDVINEFTHSREINEICASMLVPHTVTPVEKETLERALSDYLQRRNISEEEEARIRAWLDDMPNDVAIIEFS